MWTKGKQTEIFNICAHMLTMATMKGNGKYEIGKKFEEISSGPEVLRMSLGIPVRLQRCLRRGKVWRDQLPGLHKRRGGF